MNEPAGIFFRFPDPASAALAKDTFEELGYQTRFSCSDGPVLHIRIDGQDLVSALEIAQGHGGILQESAHVFPDTDVYTMAYRLDEIPIPAHTVNDDVQSAEQGKGNLHEHKSDDLVSYGDPVAADAADASPDVSPDITPEVTSDIAPDESVDRTDHFSADVRA